MLQTKLSGRNDVEAFALLDSGASYNFISQSLAKKLGWQLHKNLHMVVRLANGDKLTALGAV